ncbi:MAG: glycosyltransferase family 2 protein [Microgenomates group bacterium]|jgi:hypothetical protein
MKKDMLVSVVIPSWNGIELLNDCLLSLEKQSYKSLEVIVVDNGSSDDSVKYIKSNFPKFKVVELSYNQGFSVAVNIGIKKSLGEYIFILNNDTEVDKNCILHLVKALSKNQEVGMMASKILNFYQRDFIDNAGDELDTVGHLLVKGYGKKDGLKFSKQYSLFLVSGGGSLFKREVFEKIGYFDESYFMYMEDADLCFRAQLAGFRALFEPRAIIYHKRMATSSKNLSLVECLNFRNMTMNIIKDFPVALLMHNFNWLKIILVNLNTLKYLIGKGYLMGALKAEWFILCNLRVLFEKRKIIQKSKIVSDQYIIKNVKEKRCNIF